MEVPNSLAQDSCRVIPAAHRAGARELGLADHSRLAIQQALQDGLQMIEVDLQESRDGVPFLVHGKHLRSREYVLPRELTTTRVNALTAKELRHIAPHARPDEGLLSLEDMMGLIRNFQGLVLIDPKGEDNDTFLERIMAIVSRHSAVSKIAVQCSPIHECQLLHQSHPTVKLFLRIFSESDFDVVDAVRPFGIQIDEPLLSSPNVRNARSSGVLIMVKSLDGLVDGPDHWRAMREAGADVVLSDYPRAFRHTICSGQK